MDRSLDSGMLYYFLSTIADVSSNPSIKGSLKQEFYEKTMYQATSQIANSKDANFLFFGPNAVDDTPGPMKFTRPYFDYGRSNKWLFAAVAPIVGLHPPDTRFKKDYSK